MRNHSTNGFTLIEFLIVIAIIGIFAAVLIPNLLNARKRAFDTQAMSCLREIATQEEVIATDDPHTYANSPADILATLPDTIACDAADVTVAAGLPAPANGFHYTAFAIRGTTGNVYEVKNGTGVVPQPPPLTIVRGTDGQRPGRRR